MWRLPETLQPRLRELLGLFELLGVQVMEAVVVIVVLGAGDELPQTHGPILGEREVLDKLHIARLRRTDRENRPRQRDHYAFHRNTSCRFRDGSPRLRPHSRVSGPHTL